MVLIDRQQLSACDGPATRREISREGDDFAEERLIRIDAAVSIARRKNPLCRDEIRHRERRLLVVEWLRGAAGTDRHLRVRQSHRRLANVRSNRVAGRHTDDVAAAQIRQGEIVVAITPVGRADDIEERVVSSDRQKLSIREGPAKRREVSRERNDFPQKIVSAARVGEGKVPLMLTM